MKTIPITITIILMALGSYLHAQSFVQSQKLVKDGRASNDKWAQQGACVDVYDNILVAGAPYENMLTTQSSSAGAVHVYKYIGQTWSEIQRLVPQDLHIHDWFGSDVQLVDDLLFVTSSGHDYDASGNNFIQSAGAVYVYEKTAADTFQFLQKLVASDRALTVNSWIDWKSFGWDICADSNTLFVSSLSGFDSGQNYLQQSGAVYRFERNASGLFVEQEIITPTIRYATDRFGWELSMQDSSLMVSAPRHDYDENDTNYLSNAGKVYHFRLNASSNWYQFEEVVSDSRAAGMQFGEVIEVNEDVLCVRSGLGSSFSYEREVQIFERAAGNQHTYLQSLSYLQNQATGWSNSNFGNDIELFNDKLAIGADHDGSHVYNGYTETGEGAFLTYSFTGDSFMLDSIYKPCIDDSIGLGSALAFADGWLMVGASRDSWDEHHNNLIRYAGAVYGFQWGNSNPSSLTGILEDTVDVCEGAMATIHIDSSSVLSSGATWGLYFGNCTDSLIDTTSSFSFSFTPSVSGHYSVRSAGSGEGMCATCLSAYVQLHYPDSINQTITTCDSVYVGGQWIDSSQTVIQTLSNQFGCDSIVTYNVTINYSAQAFDTVIGIDSVVLYGFVFYESTSTDTTFAGAAQNGCDSTVTYEIVVNPLLMLRGETTSEHFGHDGTIDLIIDQGTAPYIYDWIHDGQGDWDDSQDLDSLTAGGYKVFVRDATGQEASLSLVVENALGVKDNTLETLTIYPNPTQMQATVQSDQIIDRIEIKSLTGETVEVIQVNDLHVQLNFAGYSRGLYFIQITSGDVVTSRRVILD